MRALLWWAAALMLSAVAVLSFAGFDSRGHRADWARDFAPAPLNWRPYAKPFLLP